MGNDMLFQIGMVVAALLVAVALLRIYVGAVLPLLRNQRLARRGISAEPAYRREGRNIFGLALKVVSALAVVAVLAAITIPAYQNYIGKAQVAAQDSQRIADLQLIQTALASYYVDNNAYPVSETETLDVAGFGAALSALVTGGYLAILPNDPDGEPVSYVYQSTSDGTYYCLGATLQGPPPPSTCDTGKLGSVPDANYTVGP